MLRATNPLTPNNMAQQTAVQSLLNNLLGNGLLRLSKHEHKLYQALKEQALQMEEQNAFEIFKAGQNSMEEGGKSFDQFYNEAFKPE